MESLPDDVLLQILQIGAKTRRLDHVDLCSLAIVNSRFDGLTRESSLSATLLSLDFPSPSKFRAPSKAIYREQLEKKRKLESLNHRFRHFMFPPLPSLFPTNSNWNSSQSYFPRQVMQVNSRPQSAFINPYPFSKTDYWYVGPQAGPPPPPSYAYANASHPSLRQEPKRYYEKKPSNWLDKSSRFQVIPLSKSYVPMNRPPRRSMPRKI